MHYTNHTTPQLQLRDITTTTWLQPHYITLRYTSYSTLHYNTLHYTPLHYTLLHYTTLNYSYNYNYNYTRLHYTSSTAQDSADSFTKGNL